MSEVLDGNAAGGAARRGAEPGAHCGAGRPVTPVGEVRAIGELQAYPTSPGIVLRCAACEAVQIRLVRGRRHVWLDLRGVQVLQVEFSSSE